MGIGTCVYVKNSKEAVELYMDVFGLELGYHVLNDDGSYYHSELNCDGQEFMSVVEKPENAGLVEHITQLSVAFNNADEVRRAYEKLKEGGIIDLEIGELPWSECAASVVDRFGVYWYISCCSHIPDDSFDPHEPIRTEK